jgi:nitroimidazol reductase NimA-like FMN-containing flavoprotein (pyridoxamine 5'-phosphate oxidase superfamily)
MNEFAKTSRNQVRRMPARGAYDRETIYPILDEALICHVAFAVEGQPYVIPTIHARAGDVLYLHGAPASRLLKHIMQGHPLCITCTLLDGLVIARSVFHHSVNYRSAIVFGTGRQVTELQEKEQALALLTEHIARGRWDEARQPNSRELAATEVVAVQIESASAKMRSGGPQDDDEDYDLPIWAGVLPLALLPLIPQQDERQSFGVDLPASIQNYSRGR